MQMIRGYFAGFCEKISASWLRKVEISVCVFVGEVPQK